MQTFVKIEFYNNQTKHLISLNATYFIFLAEKVDERVTFNAVSLEGVTNCLFLGGNLF